MKRDFAKVIKKSRSGGKYNRKGKSIDIESSPKIESMRRKSDLKSKNNISTRPIKRFCISRLGQKWDNVWKEVCSVSSLDNFSQKQFRDMVLHIVKTNISIVEGKIYFQPKWGPRRELNFNDLYVHPETNILSCYKENQYKKRNNKMTLQRAMELLPKSIPINFKDGELKKENEDLFLKTKIWNKLNNHDILAIVNTLKFNGSIQRFYEIINTYRKEIKETEELRTILKTLQEITKIKHRTDFNVGDKVLVSKDGGKTFREGFVNRIEYIETQIKPHVYWILCGSDNLYIQRYNSLHVIKKA